MAEPNFWGKFLFCLKWGKWGIFGPTINIFEILYFLYFLFSFVDFQKLTFLWFPDVQWLSLRHNFVNSIHLIYSWSFVSEWVSTEVFASRFFFIIAFLKWATKPFSKAWTQVLWRSNPACGVSETCNGHNLWEWFCLKARLKAFHQSTILQKQFIIIIIVIIVSKSVY